MNMLFVMNPCAGTRKANKVLTEILGLFCEAGYTVQVHVTKARGEATQVVAEKASQVDLIVCCGGDGTFNETVAGVMKSGVDVPIGYIPAGSTNDFAESLGLKTGNPLGAAQDIINGTPQSYDIGLFGDRIFTYVASFGAFTKTSYTTPQNIKNALGHTAYILEGVQELSQLKSLPVELELEDETVKGEFLFGAISNSTRMGGVLNLDLKQVDMADGLFEVLLVRAPKDLSEIAECIQAVQKQKYNCKMITFRSTKKVIVRTKKDMAWTLDGEREPGHEQVEVQNLHHAIRLVK